MAGNIGGGREGDDDLISGINVTPLVDIVLVLLIIFMVTASYIVRAAIEVELPRAASASEAAGTTLAVVITSGGDVFLDGVRRSEPELAERAREAARRGDVRAVVSADRATLHGSVVRVIDVLKGSGVTRFAIHVERESPR
ncbi:MAG TPA: biopolymer transporter ExbD [Anaeromyxobacteraceae bacterium]|nr:biopolymer transporter ExbD [Anaeromyxobacteraceae bacterium]